MDDIFIVCSILLAFGMWFYLVEFRPRKKTVNKYNRLNDELNRKLSYYTQVINSCENSAQVKITVKWFNGILKNHRRTNRDYSSIDLISIIKDKASLIEDRKLTKLN